MTDTPMPTSASPLRFCPRCQREGKTSKVFFLGGTSTAMMNAEGEDFWDEKGVWHRHDVNVITSGYQCSNLHRWTERHGRMCPAPGCDWSGLIDGIVVDEST